MLTTFFMMGARICKDDLTREVGTGSSLQDFFGAEAIIERISSSDNSPNFQKCCCAQMEESSDKESEDGDTYDMLVESMVVKMFTFRTKKLESSCERTAMSEWGVRGCC